jgi:hypothetical protein
MPLHWPTRAKLCSNPLVCLGVKQESEAQNQMLIVVRQLIVVDVGFFLTRGRVRCLQLLPALVSIVIVGSEPRGTF